jgi:hypothetical protein
MFKLLDNEARETVEIELDGELVSVPADISIAAALLQLDAIPFRSSPISGAPRAPFCMMGVCFECLLEVDGVSGQRACQVLVRAGTRIRRRLTDYAGESG